MSDDPIQAPPETGAVSTGTAPSTDAVTPAAADTATLPSGGVPAGNDAPAAPHAATKMRQRLPPDKTGSDNVDLLKSAFVGVLFTAIAYEVFPLPFLDHGRVTQVFDNPISEVIVAVTAWALVLLGYKYRRYRRQFKGMEIFERPGVGAVFEAGVFAREIDKIQNQLREVLKAQSTKGIDQLIIYRRVFKVLQYIRSVPKKEGINDLLDYQSQIDLKKLESGYTILNVAIWAIPILGFIGTVLGIGEAVNEFSIFIQTAESGATFGTQMRTALGGVTGGLAVAFNTTFLALVLVIPLMVLASILHKNEETLLLAVEEYCLEDLLPHLHITPASAIHENYEEHLHRIIQLSNTWLGELEPLVKNISTQSEMLTHQMSGVQPLIRDFTDRIGGREAPDGNRGAASSGSKPNAEGPAASGPPVPSGSEGAAGDAQGGSSAASSETAGSSEAAGAHSNSTDD